MSATAVDQQLMVRLMQQLEMTANRRGWDRPATLYVLYNWHDQETEHRYRELLSGAGQVVRCGPYAARPMVRSELLSGAPHHALFRLALNLAYSDHPMVGQLVGATRQAGFLGMAFACEGWGRTYDDLEERAAEGDVRFADMPGSMEMRFVIAADVRGGSHAVERRRGNRPQTLDVPDYGGSVVESLQAITARISGQPVPEIVNVPTGWPG